MTPLLPPSSIEKRHQLASIQAALGETDVDINIQERYKEG